MVIIPYTNNVGSLSPSEREPFVDKSRYAEDVSERRHSNYNLIKHGKIAFNMVLSPILT